MANFKGIENVYLYDEQEKKMKVMVIGSGGWIGGYVTKELLKNPDIEVIAPISVGSFPKIAHERLTYTTKRIADIEDVPDAVIYLAWPDLDYYDSPNHLSFAADSYKILKSLVDKGVRNITVTGTCFEYGKVEGELSEDMPANPHCNYAIGKDALRRMLSALDIDLKWLRLFYLYGEGQREQSLVPRFLKQIKEGKTEIFVPGLNKVRDYLYIEDAAKYIVACAMQTEVKGITNVCSGETLAIWQILTEAFDREGYFDIAIKHSGEEYPDYGAHSFWGNNKKLKRIIK